MFQIIPKNMCKRLNIDSMEVTGYKSMRMDLNLSAMDQIRQAEEFEEKDIDPDGAHIIFNEGKFKLEIHGKENLENLKNIIEFALKFERPRFEKREK